MWYLMMGMVIMAKNFKKHVSWSLLQQSSYLASVQDESVHGNIPGLVAQNRQVMSGFSEHLGEKTLKS